MTIEKSIPVVNVYVLMLVSVFSSRRMACISSIPWELYLIIAKAEYSLRLMRYVCGDDIPLLSQWIKKSKSFDLDFLAGVAGLEDLPCNRKRLHKRISCRNSFVRG